ncbi:MAG: hypothetical protein ABH814_01530 [bacterium]
MNRTLLVTRPQHDMVTTYFYHWSQPLIEEAKKKKLVVCDLKGKKAVMGEFWGRVKKLAPMLIFLNGHGSESIIGGHNNETLVDASTVNGNFKGSVIYARACSAAQELGEKIATDSASTFIGYDEPFVFLQQKEFNTKPLRDNIAALFMKPSNSAVLALIKGHCAKDANTRSRNEFMSTIYKILTSEATSEETESIPYLYWDYKHQVCLGKPENRLAR